MVCSDGLRDLDGRDEVVGFDVQIVRRHIFQHAGWVLGEVTAMTGEDDTKFRVTAFDRSDIRFKQFFGGNLLRNGVNQVISGEARVHGAHDKVETASYETVVLLVSGTEALKELEGHGLFTLDARCRARLVINERSSLAQLESADWPAVGLGKRGVLVCWSNSS